MIGYTKTQISLATIWVRNGGLEEQSSWDRNFINCSDLFKGNNYEAKESIMAVSEASAVSLLKLILLSLT